MRIAVTGASGRPGQSLISALEEAPFTGPFGPIAWDGRQLDLDDPSGVGRHLDADRVELVIHAAAWTDAAGCARDPELALRRNGVATGVLAEACAARGLDLMVLSTSEVFDGRRTDARGYSHTDPTGPITAYGASRLAGEQAAVAAYEAAGADGGRFGIVRAGWLFGPPGIDARPPAGGDVPAQVLSAAEQAMAESRPLRVAAGLTGSPTYAPDLAEGIAEIAGSGDVSGVHHLVNAGAVGLAGWAREVLRLAGLPVAVEEALPGVDPDLFAPGTSGPAAPAWTVLEPTPMPSGEPIRPWWEALADEVFALLRAQRSGRTR